MYTNRLLNEFYPKITQGTGARAPVSVHAALDSPSPATIGSYVPAPLVDQVQTRSKEKAWVKMKLPLMNQWPAVVAWVTLTCKLLL